jgi:peptidoglycan/LPS O-acetylase OafA/YrhL
MLASEISRASASHPDLPRAAYYRPELDALRFFRFLLVFCGHVDLRRPWLMPLADIGALGLPIFFTLSAFLIVSILLREREQTGTVAVRAFMLRRVLRIWPLYFAVIGVTWYIGGLDPQLQRTEVLELSLMLGNLYVLQHGWLALGVLVPIWSISVEEQFYLAVPWTVKFGGKRLILATCLLTLAIAYATLAVLGHRSATPSLEVWANSFVQFQFFAAGGLLALLLHRRHVRLPVPVRLLLFAAGCACFYRAVYLDRIHWPAPTGGRHLVAGYITVLLATCAMLIAVLDFPWKVPPLLRYLGKISYGLYLLHMLVYVELYYMSVQYSPKLNA